MKSKNVVNDSCFKLVKDERIKLIVNLNSFIFGAIIAFVGLNDFFNNYYYKKRPHRA